MVKEWIVFDECPGVYRSRCEVVEVEVVWYMVKSMWQVYVYILLKANRYDAGLEEALTQLCDPSTATKWVNLVVRNTWRMARRRTIWAHQRQTSKTQTPPLSALGVSLMNRPCVDGTRKDARAT